MRQGKQRNWYTQRGKRVPGEERRPLAVGVSGSQPCCRCKRPVQRNYLVYDSVWRQAILKLGDRGGQHMAPDSVWRQAGVTPPAAIWTNLHISCLERVLGRRLRKRDFYSGSRLLRVRQ